MSSDNYYDFLGISEDATNQEIKDACNRKMGELFVLNSTGALTPDQYSEQYAEIESAFKTLLDAKKRKKYDKQLKKGSRRPGNSGGIAKKLRTGAVVAALCASLIGGGLFAYNKITGNDVSDLFGGGYKSAVVGTESEQPSASQQSDESKSQDGSSSSSSSEDTSKAGKKDEEDEKGKETPAPAQQNDDKAQQNGTGTQSSNGSTGSESVPDQSATLSTLPPLVNYGDVTDGSLLDQRANALLSELNAAGLFNMATNAPYTVDEIKSVIQYMNGTYVPTDEVDAMSKTDDFLNLALAPLNSESFIYTVNYMGGEDSFKPNVEASAANFKRVNFVKNCLFGDSTVGPYLQWIEDQYCAMLTTTDREECNRIYNSVLQSLADFSFGQGFELDGKVYKEQMALGLDKINSGNVLQLLVYILEPLRTGKANDYYTVVDPYFDASTEDNKFAIPYLQISEWYTPLCDYDHYELDDNGLFLIDQNAVPEVGIEQRLQEGHNFANVNQMNTINAGLEQLYGKNLSTGKTLTK